MKDLFLKGAVAIDNMRRRIADRAVEEYDARRESGDIVQTIIIIAGFVLICIIVIGILNTAIQGQAEKVGECITKANSGACTNFQK